MTALAIIVLLAAAADEPAKVRASHRVEPASQRCAYRALAASGEYQPMTVS